MEKKDQKIMVAIDESQESMYALSWCITNLISDTPTNNKLVLLYVRPPSAFYTLDAAGYIFNTDVVDAMEKYSMHLANSVMERAEAICRDLNATNINMERVVGIGDAKNVICRAVKKLEADTLVMGTHGYGFFKRALLGSVSDHCAKHANCPVVIVKHP
ncbi:universal stress protein A-like protein [Cajanus cajan]|uniref:Universal stress protein A-like protein n=1 Tax=Cajanus cajan TaxID=3821 RepID=A0A151SNK3_CAJCA|nr:universal stress protein A-like protein [Cajanus cajan]KYP56329.1 Universal stress protein A-like protein [Cajanus cajan]